MATYSGSPSIAGRWNSLGTWSTGTTYGAEGAPGAFQFDTGIPAGATVSSAVLAFSTDISTPRTAGVVDQAAPEDLPGSHLSASLRGSISSSGASASLDFTSLIAPLFADPASNGRLVFRVWRNSGTAGTSISSITLTVEYSTSVSYPVAGEVVSDAVVSLTAGRERAVSGEVGSDAAVSLTATLPGYVALTVASDAVVSGVVARAAAVSGAVVSDATVAAAPRRSKRVSGAVVSDVWVSGSLTLPRVLSWQEWIRTEAWATAIHDPARRVRVRGEILNPDGVVVRDLSVDDGLLLGGQVTCDGDRRGTWSGSISVHRSLIPQSEWDLLHPFARNRVRLWWDLWVRSRWVPLPIGTFYNRMPKLSDDGAGVTVTVELVSPLEFVSRAKWNEALSVGGMDAADAIGAILRNRAPWLPIQVTPAGYDLPATWELGAPGKDPLDDVAAIAEAGSLVVLVDRLGQAVVKPRPTGRSAVASFVEGPDCLVSEISSETDESTVLNSVTFRSSSSEVDPPVSGSAQITDGALAVSRSWLLHEDFTSDVATTAEQCVQLSQNKLADLRSITTLETLTHAARPDIEPWDVVAAQRVRIGVVGDRTVRAWSMTLDHTPGQHTTVSGVRTF